jgi:hypothetical protein
MLANWYRRGLEKAAATYSENELKATIAELCSTKIRTVIDESVLFGVRAHPRIGIVPPESMDKVQMAPPFLSKTIHANLEPDIKRLSNAVATQTVTTMNMLTTYLSKPPETRERLRQEMNQIQQMQAQKGTTREKARSMLAREV